MAVMKFKETFTNISNGTTICIPIFRNILEIAVAVISLYGFGIVNDGRNVLVSGLMNLTALVGGQYTLNITIDCFGTSID